MSTAAARQRVYRERERGGRIVVAIEVDAVAVGQALEQAGLLPLITDHTREDIAQAIERLLTLLGDA
jgi:hypothetical protein